MAESQNKSMDIEALSFEKAMAELEAIVRKLETGQGGLEEAISEYTRGTALKEHCERKLKDARLKVEKIIKGAGGEITAEEFEAS